MPRDPPCPVGIQAHRQGPSYSGSVNAASKSQDPFWLCGVRGRGGKIYMRAARAPGHPMRATLPIALVALGLTAALGFAADKERPFGEPPPPGRHVEERPFGGPPPKYRGQQPPQETRYGKRCRTELQNLPARKGALAGRHVHLPGRSHGAGQGRGVARSRTFARSATSDLLDANPLGVLVLLDR